MATTDKGLAVDTIRVDQHYQKNILQMIDTLKTINIDGLAIIDREGCGLEFHNNLQAKGIKVLTPLRANQYKSLKDFQCVKTGENIYVGQCKEKHLKDDRTFVIIDYTDRLCVFAMTWEEKDGTQIPALYKTRWPNNEEVIKNFTSFNVNVGNGVIKIPDPDSETACIKKLSQRRKKLLSIKTE